MKLQVYAIFDKKTNAYLSPFMQVATGQAIRSFQDSIKDPQAPFGKHPEDYAMYYLCDFDDLAGTYTQKNPELIQHASALIEPKKEN